VYFKIEFSRINFSYIFLYKEYYHKNEFCYGSNDVVLTEDVMVAFTVAMNNNTCDSN